MDQAVIIQGREIGGKELSTIRDLICENPGFSRYKLSRELCELWQWRDARGRLKDMAARSLLGKLAERGWIELPPKRMLSPNRFRQAKRRWVEHSREPFEGSLRKLGPLEIREVSTSPRELALFECLLQQYHYLSYSGTVGLNLKYLIVTAEGGPAACLLFGSAAWKCEVRDRFIGWSARQRRENLQAITNNTRFLILPWVKAPCLASHILGGVLRRIAHDWESKYRCRLHLVETFVDISRFHGGCYRAANWRLLGQTKGRTRQDRYNRIQVPPKRVFVYPLGKNFRRELCR